MQETQEMWVRFLGWEDPLEKEMATHSSIIAGRSHGQRNLVGYSPWGFKESNNLATKQQQHIQVRFAQCHRASKFLHHNLKTHLLTPCLGFCSMYLSNESKVSMNLVKKRDSLIILSLP